MISMETGNQHKILMDVECCLSQNQMCCLCCVYEVHFKTEVKFALHYPDPPSNFVVATCLYFVVTINTPTTCQSYDCLYVVGCTKCPYQYIGKAVGRKLTTRWGEHRGYVNRKQLDKTTGEHFNSRGHSVANMTFTGLEQCMNKDPEYLGKREVHQITSFDAKYSGLNRRF